MAAAAPKMVLQINHRERLLLTKAAHEPLHLNGFYLAHPVFSGLEANVRRLSEHSFERAVRRAVIDCVGLDVDSDEWFSENPTDAIESSIRSASLRHGMMI